jgi:hypothetical protein
LCGDATRAEAPITLLAFWRHLLLMAETDGPVSMFQPVIVVDIIV